MKFYKVSTVSTFHHTYLVAQPDEANPASCQDSVTCEEVEDFTQKYLGEVVIEYKEVTDEEIMVDVKEHSFLDSWTLEEIKRRVVHYV